MRRAGVPRAQGGEGALETASRRGGGRGSVLRSLPGAASSLLAPARRRALSLPNGAEFLPDSPAAQFSPHAALRRWNVAAQNEANLAAELPGRTKPPGLERNRTDPKAPAKLTEKFTLKLPTGGITRPT